MLSFIKKVDNSISLCKIKNCRKVDNSINLYTIKNYRKVIHYGLIFNADSTTGGIVVDKKTGRIIYTDESLSLENRERLESFILNNDLPLYGDVK